MFRGIPIEILHGKMKPKEKDEIIERFKKNEIGRQQDFIACKKIIIWRDCGSIRKGTDRSYT